MAFSFLGVTMVVFPNPFRKLFLQTLGIPDNNNSLAPESSPNYIYGIMLGFSVPFLASVISLCWKLNPQIRPFVNLFYWSILMMVISVYLMIFADFSSISNFIILFCLSYDKK